MSNDLIEKAKLTDEEMYKIYSTEGLDDLCLKIAQAQLDKLLNTVIKEAGICGKEAKTVREILEEV